MTLGRAAHVVGLALAIVFLVPAGATARSQPFVGPSIIVSVANDLSPPLAALGDPRPPLLSGVGETGGGSLLGPVESFEGIANEENQLGATGIPPDTNGAVGPLDYVQSVNNAIAIYDKHGTRLLGPLPTHLIWKGFGGLCETTIKNDAVVRYDQLANRWLITQFAYVWPAGKPQGPYYQCFAVSKTPDPTGPYYRYVFDVGDTALDDYPKLAIWPDAYYMSANRYENGSAGAIVLAFDGAAMRAGQPARAVSFKLVDKNFLGVLPTDLDGHRPPPPDTPEVFVKVDDNDCHSPADRLEFWRFSVDFASPMLSRFTGPSLLPTGQFDSSCNSQDLVQQPDIPQPETSAPPLTAPPLDLLSDRLMFRASYRNFGTSQSLLAMHTVLGGDRRAALRWYEIRFPDGQPALRQQGTYQPDTDSDSRWLGSIAGDRAGDVAVGFSVSGKTTFPSIGYVGHAVGGGLGTLDSGEGRLVTGAGSQTWFSDWGDYSSLTVDPVDDCTFWYTQEYYPVTSTVGWHTRIGSFRFPNCGPVPSISGDSREGVTLVATPGGWPELPGATFTYQWRRCNAHGATCSDIPGATGSRYTLGTLDVDTRLRVVVTGTTPTATASALSDTSGLITPVPATGPLALATKISATPSSLTPGGQVVYTAQVANAPDSAGSATGVVLTVTLPAGTDLVSTPTFDRGSGCSETAPVVCQLDFIPGGRTATVTITARVTTRGSLTAKASAHADQPFSNPAAAEASTTIIVRAAPKLVLSTAGPLQVRRTGGAVQVSASVTLDERVTLAARAVNPRSQRSLPLLPGTTLGDVTLRSQGDRIVTSAGPGDVKVLLRIPPAWVQRTAAYSFALKATDKDGLTTSLTLRFRS
jgi:uncharacterized protein DUF11